MNALSLVFAARQSMSIYCNYHVHFQLSVFFMQLSYICWMNLALVLLPAALTSLCIVSLDKTLIYKGAVFILNQTPHCTLSQKTIFIMCL